MLVLRTHAFLERHGFINYGIYERVTPIPSPPKGKQRPKVVIIGAGNTITQRLLWGTFFMREAGW